MTQRTRHDIKVFFEAGDRPNDIEFADLFDSIVFLNDTNGVAGDSTIILGDLTVGGGITLTDTSANFQMGGNFMAGSIDETSTMPIQAYSDQDETIIFASGSESDIMFQGVSGDPTSSIRLQDPTEYVRFGTHTGRAFIEVAGNEIINITGSNKPNGFSTFISGSVAMATGTDEVIIGDFTSSIEDIDSTVGTLFPGITPKLTIDTGDSTGGYEEAVVIKHKEKSATVADRQLGLLLKLSNETTQGESNKMGGIVLKSTSAYANNPELLFVLGNNERMRIDDDGNVGIGTSNPSNHLHILDTTDDAHIRLETDKTDGRAQILYLNDAQQFTVGLATNDNFVVYDTTNTTSPFIVEPGVASNTLRVATTGVGINTNDPKQALHVVGNIILGDNSGGTTGNSFIHQRDNLGLSADGRILIVADANDTAGGLGGSNQDIIFGAGSAIDLNSSPGESYDNTFGTVEAAGLPRVEIMRIDTSNERVGIKTTTPDNPLTVDGRANFTDRVGIGTNMGTPGHQLEIQSAGANSDVVVIRNAADTQDLFQFSELTGNDSLMDMYNDVGDVHIRLHTDGKSYLRGGNVAFGSTTANQLVHISVSDEYFATNQGSYPWGAAETLGVRLGTPTAAGGINYNAGALEFRRWTGTALNHHSAAITQENDGGWGLAFKTGEFASNTHATATRMFIESDNGGRIGMGTTNPDSRLHVVHTGDSLGDVDFLHLQIGSTTTEGSASIKFSDYHDPSNQHMKITFMEGSNDLVFHSDATNGQNLLYVESQYPRLGIGARPARTAYTLQISPPYDALSSNGAGGLIFLTDVNTTNGIHTHGGYVGTAWDNTTSGYNYLYLGSSFYDGANWKTNIGPAWGSNHRMNINLVSDGIRFVTSTATANTTITEDTATFLSHTSMIIKPDGKVGIGTATPSFELEVDGDVKVDNLLMDGGFYNNNAIYTGGSNHNKWYRVFSFAYGSYGHQNVRLFHQEGGNSSNNNPNNQISFNFKNQNASGQYLNMSIQGSGQAPVSSSQFRVVHDNSSPTTNPSNGVVYFYYKPNSTYNRSSWSVVGYTNLDLTWGDGTAMSEATFNAETASFSNPNTWTEHKILNTIFTDGDNGNTGLGITNPTADLQILAKGTMASATDMATSRNGATIAILSKVDGSSTEMHIDPNEFTVQDGNLYIGAFAQGNNAGAGNIYIRTREDAGSVQNRLFVDVAGNIGIGTTSPGQKLTIDSGHLSLDGGYKIGTNIGDAANEYSYTPYVASGVQSQTGIGSHAVYDNGSILKSDGQITFTETDNNKATHIFDVNNNRTRFRGYLTVHDPADERGGLQIYTYSTGSGIASSTVQSPGDSSGFFAGQFGDSSVHAADGVKLNRIYFPAHNGSSDSGMIVHETSNTAGYTNKATLHLCPSDDADNTQDYVAIHGRNCDERIRLYTGGYAQFTGTVSIRSVHSSEGGQLSLHGGTSGNDVRFDMDIYQDGLRIFSNTAGAFTHHAISAEPTLGRVGIGTQTPGTARQLLIKQTTANYGIHLQAQHSTDYWAIDYMDTNAGGNGPADALRFGWKGSNTNGGYLAYSADVHQIDFTGQHRNKSANQMIDYYNDKVGYIVIADGTYDNFPESANRTGANINESLPKVKLSEEAKDKRVFGVISDAEDYDSDSRTFSAGNWTSAYPKERFDDRLIINSVGEGAIMVCSYNGNLENGDYITTSPALGLGMKQDDDLLHNYTVAKITQDCHFDEDDELPTIGINNVAYKYKLVGCTYHCG